MKKLMKLMRKVVELENLLEIAQKSSAYYEARWNKKANDEVELYNELGAAQKFFGGGWAAFANQYAAKLRANKTTAHKQQEQVANTLWAGKVTRAGLDTGSDVMQGIGSVNNPNQQASDPNPQAQQLRPAPYPGTPI